MKHNTDPQNPESGRAQSQSEHSTNPQVLTSLLSPRRLLRIARHLILLGKKAIARQHQSWQFGAMRYCNSDSREKIFFYLMTFSSTALLAGISYRVLRFMLEDPHTVFTMFCATTGLEVAMIMFLWADRKQREKDEEEMARDFSDVMVDFQPPE